MAVLLADCKQWNIRPAAQAANPANVMGATRIVREIEGERPYLFRLTFHPDGVTITGRFYTYC
jgi:hypothetical protein